MSKMEKGAIRASLFRHSGRLPWIYGVAAIVSFGVFFVFWCTNIFRDAILSGLVLRNGSFAFAWWQRPPVTLVTKIYIFNYTNVHEFESGAATKLRVQEVGPYVYTETLSRVNVELHENGTVTYQEKRSYVWRGGSFDNEPVVVPNVLLVGAVAYTRNMNFFAKFAMTIGLTTLRAKPFVEVTAGEFLWGYDDNLFNVAKMSLKQPVQFDKFGILAFKKGVNQDRITMHTGLKDLGDLGLIERINGMADRKTWGDERCDRVHGTDGSMFPPYSIRDTNTTLYVYAKDICRAIPFRYVGRGQAYGIPTLRYKIPSDTFEWNVPQNECFCTKSSTSSENEERICPPSGIFNMSVCGMTSPLLLSYPHFYLADQSLLDHVDGLEPRQENHETYVDLHPRLGTPIGGWSRFQLNLDVKKAAGVPVLGKLKDGTILPLIWIDAGIDKLPKPVYEAVYDAHFVAGAIEACFQWCSLIAVVLTFGAFVTALKRQTRVEPTLGLQRNSSGQSRLIE